MKLTVNVITGGRFVEAGTEIPDSEVSLAMRAFAIPSGEADANDGGGYSQTLQHQRSDADAAEYEPAPRGASTRVKRKHRKGD